MWPPINYKPTHLGEKHDFMHYCLNLNAIISNEVYSKHIKSKTEISKELYNNPNENVSIPTINDLEGPLVSIIIPVFNASKTIWRCLSSIIRQGIPNIEILLVDDSSTDNSEEEIQAFKEVHPDYNIQILKNNRTKGVSGSRNKGIDAARGRYIAFLDADDCWDYGSLAHRVACLKRDPSIKMVHGPVRFVNGNNTYLGITHAHEKELTFLDCKSNPLHLNGLIIDSDLVKKFHFDENLANGEDWLFISQILRCGYTSIFCPKGGAVYTLSNLSTVIKNPLRHEATLEKVIDRICTPQSDLPYAPEYIAGLGNSDREKMVRSRKISTILYALLFGDLSSLCNIISQNSIVSLVDKISEKEIQSALHVPLIRRFQIPLDKLHTVCNESHKQLYSLMMDFSGMRQLLPNFANSINTALNINKKESNNELINYNKIDFKSLEVGTKEIEKSVLIMGNGPSAALTDFKQLKFSAVKTVGMNAAYRLWDEIDFRPNYYICMDTVVIKSHQDEIFRLILENKIEKFFLRDEILEKYPNLVNNPRILWYSQAKKNSWIFDTNSITTGSWAIRWMVFNGFNKIGLIGIDSNYVEILPEAERYDSGGSLELKIKRTPTWNPNYFFTGYQREGDLYNIPNNPDVLQSTGKNTHILALSRANRDTQIFNHRVIICDCSPLSEHGIFPKKQISSFLDDQTLSLVTSFKSPSELDDAMPLALTLQANARNRMIKGVHLLFEGSWNDFVSKLPIQISSELERLCELGRINIFPIAKRPSFYDLFKYAQENVHGPTAVTNADIYITESSCLCATNEIRKRESGSTSSLILALTRWNITHNGLFLQGMQSNPPWQEIAVENINAWEFNSFSYDTYIFNKIHFIPKALAEVFVGTYGCDTAVAAILKIAGYNVRNPSKSIKCTHFDDKTRSYSTDASRRDLVINVNAVKTQLVEYTRFNNEFKQLLDFKEGFSKNSLWLAGSTTIDVFHSFFRALGATPPEEIGRTTFYNYKKISITGNNVSASEKEIYDLIHYPFSGPTFIEWEISGNPKNSHVSEILKNIFANSNVSHQISNYQWQLHFAVDQCNDQQRKLYQVIRLFIKNILLDSFRCSVQDTNNQLYSTDKYQSGQISCNVANTSGFNHIGINKWSTTTKSTNENEHIIQFFETPVIPGTEISIVFRLQATVNLCVRASLARHGKTPYEGTAQELRCDDMSDNLFILKHKCISAHESIKLQINILSQESDAAEISINCIMVSLNGLIVNNYLQEPIFQTSGIKNSDTNLTIVSNKQTVALISEDSEVCTKPNDGKNAFQIGTLEKPSEKKSSITYRKSQFAKANSLYRRGKFTEALQIFNELQKGCPELTIYQTNAEMSKNKLKV
jgi:glycosyltransferase involved in cell wall biosynthesis